MSPERLWNSRQAYASRSLVVVQVFGVIGPNLVTLEGRLVEVNFFVHVFFFLNFFFFLFVRKGHWGIKTITFGAATTMIGEL